MNKFDWIKQFYEIRSKSWNSISDIIPNEFNDYFLIHWKVGIVDDFPFDNYPLKNETIEETNKRIKIEKEFGLFLNPNENKLFRPTTLKEIAERFNVDYDYNVLNKIKRTPAIKTLGNLTISNLKSGIEKILKNEPLNLFVEDIYRHSIDKINPKQEIENLTIEDYFEWQQELGFDYCTYLFPKSMKWCITTSENLDMFLCCKNEFTSKIRSAFELELFPVKYEDKILQ
ncbi:hypothetical protein WAF17_15090 [Bernardetia sp. ABR2-2B]|uniref:hypothetical protein n=1 Tax=Bernardetia sp. ABR2-2B TaxID=3127472 RepID=UPI0030CB1852